MSASASAKAARRAARLAQNVQRAQYQADQMDIIGFGPGEDLTWDEKVAQCPVRPCDACGAPRVYGEIHCAVVSSASAVSVRVSAAR